MQEKPFAGLIFPKKTFNTVVEEIRDMASGRPTADQIEYSNHLDRLRNRINLSDGGDTKITFTGTGSPVKYAHGLKDATGKGVVPRRVILVSFAGLAQFQATYDDTNVTITATNESTGEVEVHI